MRGSDRESNPGQDTQGTKLINHRAIMITRMKMELSEACCPANTVLSWTVWRVN